MVIAPLLAMLRGLPTLEVNAKMPWAPDNPVRLPLFAMLSALPAPNVLAAMAAL